MHFLQNFKKIGKRSIEFSLTQIVVTWGLVDSQVCLQEQQRDEIQTRIFIKKCKVGTGPSKTALVIFYYGWL